MSSAGYVLDMIKRMQNNRSMMHSKSEKFKIRNRENIQSEFVDDSKRMNFKTVQKEDLEKIRAERTIQIKKERIRLAIFSVITLAIFSVLLFYVINLIL